MAFTTIIVEFSFRYRQLGLMLTRSPCYRILGMSVTGMLLRLPPPAACGLSDVQSLRSGFRLCSRLEGRPQKVENRLEQIGIRPRALCRFGTHKRKVYPPGPQRGSRFTLPRRAHLLNVSMVVLKQS